MCSIHFNVGSYIYILCLAVFAYYPILYCYHLNHGAWYTSQFSVHSQPPTLTFSTTTTHPHIQHNNHLPSHSCCTWYSVDIKPRLPIYHECTHKDEEKAVDLVITAGAHHANEGNKHNSTPSGNDEVGAIQ